MIGVTIIAFLINQLIAIILAGIIFVIYLIVYLIALSTKKRLLRLVQEYPLINDDDIANKLNRSLDDIRSILSSLSKHQKNKKWLIVSLNKRYLFLNENAVENFVHLHSQGYNEKEILENLSQHMRLRSRAEVKAIENTLAEQNRLRSRSMVQSNGRVTRR
jgi:hypothetical protein